VTPEEQRDGLLKIELGIQNDYGIDLDLSEGRQQFCRFIVIKIRKAQEHSSFKFCPALMYIKMILTLVTTTLGDTNAVNHLVLGEDGIDGDRLLELFLSPIDLLADGASVDLDLHDVSLLLALLHQLHL
jgi:hypothetical protein